MSHVGDGILGINCQMITLVNEIDNICVNYAYVIVYMWGE